MKTIRQVFTLILLFSGFASAALTASSSDIYIFTNDVSTGPQKVVAPGNGDNIIIVDSLQGLKVTLRGNLPVPGPASYFWDFGDGTYAEGEVVTHTFPYAGNYTVSLTTQSESGYTSTSSLSVATEEMILLPRCDNYAAISYIQGLSVSLASGMIYPQDAYYYWQFGDGTTSSDQFVSHTYAMAGTYTISLITTTYQECRDTTLITLALPLDTNNFTICPNYFWVKNISGLTDSLTGGLVNPQDAVYSWSFGDGTFGEGRYILHSYINPGEYRIMLTTLNSDGCLAISSDMVQLFDDTPEECKHSVKYQSNGLTTIFHAELNNSEIGSYSWDFGDGTQGLGKDIIHTFPGYGAFVVTLTTESTVTKCLYISSRTISLSDSVAAGCKCHFIVSAGSDPYEVNFEASNQPEIPAVYNWNFDDQGLGTGQFITHRFSQPGIYQIHLNTADSNNCISSYSTKVTVGDYHCYGLKGKIYTDNQATTETSVYLFRQETWGKSHLLAQTTPDSANYYNFHSVGSGLYRLMAVPESGSAKADLFLPVYYGGSYLWQSATVISLGTEALDAYDIHLKHYNKISGGNCSITGHLESPEGSDAIDNQEVLLLNYAAVPVRYTFTDAKGYFSFAGLPNGSYQVYPNITGITTYPQTVHLNAGNPSAQVNMSVVSNTVYSIVETKVSGGAFRMIPNPVSSTLQVFPGTGNDRNLLVNISELDGRNIIQQLIPAGGFSGSFFIDVSELSAGIYILTLDNGNGVVGSRKFMKTH